MALTILIQKTIVAMCWTRIEPGFCQYKASSATLAIKRERERARVVYEREKFCRFSSPLE